MAFLVVLEAMTPAERVAFILHDVFRYPFGEVAEIVGRTPAACRQLASSARRRIRARAGPGGPERPSRPTIVRRFKAAWEAKDIDALIGLLDPDATAIADGGGLAVTHLHPIVGGEQIARAYAEIARVSGARTTFLERTVNGLPGLVAQQDGELATVFAFEIAGDRIKQIWAVRNPEKLRPWAWGGLTGPQANERISTPASTRPLRSARAISTAPGVSPCTHTVCAENSMKLPSTASTRPSRTILRQRSTIAAGSCSTAPGSSRETSVPRGV